MDRLLLVDGSNLLFQMFYGMPARIVNAEGRAIQGTLGFVGALRKIVQRVEPTHLAVFFDGECENVRKQIDPQYKANRVDYSEVAEEENPFSQLPDIYAALDALNIRHAETCDCEVDDWIAAYVHSVAVCAQIVISSFDSDYFQLIDNRVSVLRYRGEKTVLCTPAYVRDKFGVEPEQYADYKALTGDAADHIRGAEKIGPKTAAALLQTYGTLEAALAHASEVKKLSVRASLLQNEERLRMNQKLIRLDEQVKLPLTLDELAFSGIHDTTRETLQKIGLL